MSGGLRVEVTSEWDCVPLSPVRKFLNQLTSLGRAQTSRMGCGTIHLRQLARQHLPSWNVSGIDASCRSGGGDVRASLYDGRMAELRAAIFLARSNGIRVNTDGPGIY